MIEDARPAMPWPLAIGIFILATISVTSVLVARYPVSSVPSMQVARATYLRPHDSFAAVFARLASRVDEDPAALHAIRHASLACASGVSGDWMRRRSVSASEKAFRHWQVVYCHGRSQQGWVRAYEMGEWVDIRRRHPSWAWTTPEAPGYPPDLYAGLLRDAPPPDLRMVQLVLAQDKGRHAPWRFGNDVVEHASHQDRLYRYQRMALRLLECDVVGGCGRNGVLTFELCREEGDCANGLSTNDIVRKRYAPDEVAIIEVLHRRMLQERRYYAQSQAGFRR
jgi:hypothetical protein